MGDDEVLVVLRLVHAKSLLATTATVKSVKDGLLVNTVISLTLTSDRDEREKKCVASPETAGVVSKEPLRVEIEELRLG